MLSALILTKADNGMRHLRYGERGLYDHRNLNFTEWGMWDQLH